MQRMNGIDPMFLYSETPSTPMEVAYACVFDPSSAPGGYSFESVRQLLLERIPTLTPFRRRLVEVPLGLDHPRWVDDPNFDLDNHLHRVALPGPHGEVEFSNLVAGIMGRPLCPEQPPWEMYVIEDLADDRVGLVAKVHHSVIDGVAGAQLMAQLLDLSAEGRPVTETCPPWTPPSLPSATRLLTDAVPNMLNSPLRTWRALREVGRTAVRLTRRALDDTKAPLSIPLFAPATLHRPIVGDREVALGRLDLGDMTRVRKHFGVTLNDVVLAVCSGALRSHLMEHGQAVDDSLVAIVPVSVRRRTSDLETTGNHLSAMFVALGTDRATPQERLAAVVESCTAVKAQEKAVGYGPLGSALAEAMPPALAKPVVQTGLKLGLLRRLRAGNLMVSNVPGPDFALYFAGMRMLAVHPMGPVVDGVALNITVQSYENSVFVGINASAGAIPDLPDLVDAMGKEMAALVAWAAHSTATDTGPVESATPPAQRKPVTRPSMKPAVPRASKPTAHSQRPQPVVHQGMSWD